jgi:hypothetical protein
MEESIREHLAEIALLIYILYPLLKRFWDSRKKKQEQRGRLPEAISSPPGPAPEQKPKPEPAVVAKRPTAGDFRAAAQAELDRLRQETSRLLTRARNHPRLTRFIPALQEDLLDRLDPIDRSLRSSPSLSTILQETTVLRGLEALLQNLKRMVQQRSHGGASVLDTADTIADACYAPLLDFASTQRLALRTSQPVAVTGDWDRAMVPHFATTRVAPVRLPAGFENSLWRWPGIAEEVARDFYFSLERLEPELRARLGLPLEVALPRSSAEVDGPWLRRLFGAWLVEVFADAMGTLMLGPAYVEAMRRTLRNPSSPQRTAAILQDQGRMDGHLPARLRLYIATRVLDHLGRHQEAETLWAQWEAEHGDARLYYLQVGGQWVGLSDEALHSIADSIVDNLLQEAWPELDGFQLLNIPGLAYLHAEHAAVERLLIALSRGDTVQADARWITAAAVLAAAAQPTLHDGILDAARRSIVDLRKRTEPIAKPDRPRRRVATIGESLVTSLRQRDAIEEAIILGAALKPYQPPRWR